MIEAFEERFPGFVDKIFFLKLPYLKSYPILLAVESGVENIGKKIQEKTWHKSVLPRSLQEIAQKAVVNKLQVPL